MEANNTVTISRISTEKMRALLWVCGIVTLSILIMAVLVVLATRFTETARINKLKADVEKLLGREVGETVQMDSTLDASTAAFIMEETDEVAVVIRVETFYGPMPCVYVCSPDDSKAIFIGALMVDGKIDSLLKERESRGNQSIEYWAGRIPSMVYEEDTFDSTSSIKSSSHVAIAPMVRTQGDRSEN